VVSVCDIALVSIFLCVGLMSICCGVAFFSGFLFYWCVFCCFSVVVWCVSAAGGVFASSGITVTMIVKLRRQNKNPPSCDLTRNRMQAPKIKIPSE
jgi:hypothetical protein